MCWAGQGCSLFWDCPHPRAQASSLYKFTYYLQDSWQDACGFFHTIYYVVTSRSGNKLKIYLQGSKHRDLQNEAHGPWVQAYHRESSVPSFYETSLGSRNIASILACASFCSNFFFFIFKASFVATTTSIPVSFVCCCRTSCRRRGGAAALLSIICCCSQIDYEVSTQLGIMSSSTHGTGDQLHPWAPAADSKPAVRCWWSTCGSSDPGFPQSRARSATGKRIGKTPPISSQAYSRVCSTWAGNNCHPSPWCSVAGSRSRSQFIITRIIKDWRNHG